MVNPFMLLLLLLLQAAFVPAAVQLLLPLLLTLPLQMMVPLACGMPLAAATAVVAAALCCFSLSNSCNFERTFPSQMLFSRIWGAFATATEACCLRSNSRQNASYSNRCFSSACDSFALLAAAAAPEACVRPASLTVPFGVASGGVFCVAALAPFATVPLSAIQGDAVVPVE